MDAGRRCRGPGRSIRLSLIGREQSLIDSCTATVKFVY